jgi:hypothetical protein
VLNVPGSQMPWKSQHPEQVPGPQGGVAVHCCPAHVSPNCWQLTQAWPPKPQALVRLPGVHTFPRQQPNEQFSGPQLWLSTHCPPPLHVSPIGSQFAHALPEIPHEVAELPDRQTLPEQHPGQLPGPHPAWVSQVPPAPDTTQLSPSPAQF